MMFFVMAYFLLFRAVQVPANSNDYNHGGNARENIGARHEEHDAVQPPEQGQHQRQSYAEYDFAQHGQRRGKSGFTHRLQEDERALVHAGQRRHGKKHANAPDGEAGIRHAFVRRAEDADQLTREAFEDDRRDQPDDGLQHGQPYN